MSRLKLFFVFYKVKTKKNETLLVRYSFTGVFLLNLNSTVLSLQEHPNFFGQLNFQMRKLYFSIIFLFVFRLATTTAQIDVALTVNSAEAATTCNDLLTDPDIVWVVNVNSNGDVYYPLTGNCFTALPNVQYTESYNCPVDVPEMVNVCFTVFENDPFFDPCAISPQCSETICEDFIIPALNSSVDYTLTLPGNLSSSGTLNFSVSNTTLVPVIDNDLVCDAVDLGTITYGDTLGDAATSAYYNYCATNIGDADPTLNGSFDNQSGVWFQFSTDANPAGEILIHGYSDPENLGDDIDIEIAIFESTTGDCMGQMNFLNSGFNNGALDITVPLICPSPNNTYFILVDGATTLDPENLWGVFGLELIDVGINEGGDTRCEYEDLGVVPEGGSVQTADWTSNFCATDSDDPYLPTFVSQHSVWFGFTAPPSGHVLIEGITDTLVDSIGLQIAIYRSFNNMCNGPFIHVTSDYSEAELNQTVEATCLYPDKPYFVLVDGTGFNSKGIFKLKVSDAGDITPRTTIDTTLCAGEVMEIGLSDYTESGTYADSIHLFRACDSIVFSTITFLDPIEINFTNVIPALGQTTTGQASLSVTGGTGVYTYEWCDGQTTADVSDLLGGTTCCVTVTDDKGCSEMACLDVEFITGVVGFFETDTLTCHGDENGSLVFSAANGQLPYEFVWSSPDGAFSGDGMILSDNENTIVGGNLPAGIYGVTLTDVFSADTLTIEVIEPPLLSIDLIEKIDLSCFEVCEGAIEIEVSGGTGDYVVNWANGSQDFSLSNLCAGTFDVVVTDENGCEASSSFQITEPLPFVATPIIHSVSCFEGADGAISFTYENGTPQSFEWNTGADSPSLDNLSAGFYDVTITNGNGCEAMLNMTIEAPDTPLEVSIEEINEVSCFGMSDALLQANVTGPGQTIVYDWSSGGNEVLEGALSAGFYSLTVMNEKGCEASAELTIDQPDALVMNLTPRDITCLDPINGGAIIVDTIYGGRPPYALEIDGKVVYGSSVINGLEEGNYRAVLEDASGCHLEEQVVVQGPPELLVDLDDDFTIHLGDEVSLIALSNSDNVEFSWEPLDSISGEILTDYPFVSTSYSVVAYDSITKCTAMDEVFVWVDKTRDVFVPNVFSPNDDGKNDRFFPFGGNSVVEVVSFQVYARNGMLVYDDTHFQPNNPHSGWDGTINGQAANAGVFVYKMEVEFKDGVTDIFHGDVLLMR